MPENASSVALAWLGEERATDARLVGGKTANLSRLAADFTVPDGFCLFGSGLGWRSEDHWQQLAAAYRELSERCGTSDPLVAVRSSASDEDGEGASFAGQYETVLGVRGPDAVAAAVAYCLASFDAERAAAYRREHGMTDQAWRRAVLVQWLVPADAAGVAFSLNPVSGDRSEVVINANLGIGESVVSGSVNPDTYTVRDVDVEITDRRVSEKRVMSVPKPGGVEEAAVPAALRTRPALNDEQIRATARLALDLERRMGWPVDIEFAWCRGRLYLLQCRPVTSWAKPVAPDGEQDIDTKDVSAR